MNSLDRLIELASKLAQTILGRFWWPIIRDTAQDALGAYLVLSIGGFVGKHIAGKDFSSLNICLNEWQQDPTGVTPYVCYCMVILDYALWAVVLGSLLSRAFLQLIPMSLRKHISTIRKNLFNQRMLQKDSTKTEYGGRKRD
jgi:hypothetical protein